MDSGNPINFYGKLHTPLARREVARLYGELGWWVRRHAWDDDDYQVSCAWAELVIEGKAPIRMHGEVADVGRRADELVAPLRTAGVQFIAECYGPRPERELLRVLRSRGPFEVQRAATPFVLSVAIGLVFLVVSGGGLLGVVDAPWAAQFPFGTFVLGFVLPVTLYLVWLSRCPHPVVHLDDDKLTVRSVVFPWRSATFSMDEIVAARADWEPGTSLCRVALQVTSECYERVRPLKVWHKTRPGIVSFDVLNTTMTPPEISEVIQWRVASGRESLPHAPT